MRNRRTKEGSRLRIYVDALSCVESMSLDQWIAEWALTAPADAVYVTKHQWTQYLKECIVHEASKIAYRPMLEAA